MRILLSPRFWMSSGVICLSVASATGCRSSGMGSGPGWFSWMNPKPTSSALANTPPTKPSSIASLPNPSMTTGATAATSTGTGAMPSYGGSSSQLQAAASQPPAGNHYNTGPYAMASHSHGGSPAAGLANGAQSSSGYSANTNPAASTAPGYGGYQSPYANNMNAVSRTADSRSGYPVADSSTPRTNPYATQQGVAPAANTSTEQWNRGATYGSAGSAPATFNEVPAPRGYGQTQPEQPIGTAGSWTPPAANTAATGNYLDKFPVNGDANSPSAPRRDTGPYRPGSTNRNGGSLPAPSNTTTPPATNGATSPSYPSSNYPASSYPASTYPSSGYPSSGYQTSGYQTSGYQTSGYPASSYPSMDSTSRTATSSPNSSSPYPTSGPILR